MLQSIVLPRKNVLSHLCFEAAAQILPGSGKLWSNLSTLIFQSGLVGRLLKQKSFPPCTPLETKAVRMTETLQWRESVQTSIEKSQQLTLPCLYILETF